MREDSMPDRQSAECPDVTIVIVNYKMNEVLLECLESIYRADQKVAFEIVIVDNESDGTLKKAAAEKFPKAIVLENSENAGFAAACNQGMRAGAGRNVLFLNPDTEVYPGTLSKMTGYLDGRPDVGVVGPMTVNVDGAIEPSVYNFPTVLRTLVNVLYIDNLFPKLEGYERKRMPAAPVHEDVEVICGACLMASRANLQRIGPFDEALWMYGEDVELCYRFRKAGLCAVILKDSKIIHKRGSKHLEEDTAIDMARVAYWHYRWIFHFHEKHSGPLARFLIRRLLYLSVMSKYLPRKKKLESGRNTSRDNESRVRAFEKILREFYGKKIPE